MDDGNVLKELVELSLEIGRPENDYVILGEGNTSARLDDRRFRVKSSGSHLCRANEGSFVEVDTSKALALLDGPELTEDQVKSRLAAACAHPSGDLRPSIETVFHAYLLTLPKVHFVAHTHPTSVNSILFSVNAEKIVTSRLCIHEVIYCGTEPVFVPLTSPGLGLARAIRERVSVYLDNHGFPPRQVFLQNHGLIALGQTAEECLAITAMTCKTARIILGANSLGGVNYCNLDGAERTYE